MRLFMLREYGRVIADSGKLGIADKVKTQMLHAQETAQQNQQSAAAMASAYAANAAQGGLYGAQ
jgi:hypothetical protein